MEQSSKSVSLRLDARTAVAAGLLAAREWEKNWLDQAVVALDFGTLRQAAEGGAVDAFRVEALLPRCE